MEPAHQGNAVIHHQVPLMAPAPQDPPRWQYRFMNFSRAYERMGELVSQAEARPLSDIEQEALVGRFGVAWELAWKLLKDYLQYDGVDVDPITPRSTIRAAFSAGLITMPEPWFQALDARNTIAHTYDAESFQAIVTISSAFITRFSLSRSPALRSCSRNHD